MSERMIDIVPASDDSGVARWHAVAVPGPVAGVATLRPIIPFRHDVLPAPTASEASVASETAELSLFVAPEWRRRGVGSRLLAAARAEYAGSRIVAAVADGSPEEAFCLQHGFRPTGSWRHDLLTYCDVHQAWMSELVDADHPGYRLTQWTGTILDVPEIADLLQSPGRLGNALLIAADLHGELAAYTMAVVGPLWQAGARQYGPAVLPAHRGRELDRWVNAALIERLRELHPHVNEIQAATAEDDLGLVALRGQLGYRFLHRTRLHELALP